MAFTVVGGTIYEHPPTSPYVASIALPTGTQAGDRLVMVATSDGSVACGDARLTQVVEDVGSKAGKIWHGTADGSGSAISVTLTTTTLTGLPKRACVALGVFRNTRLNLEHTEVDELQPISIPAVSKPACVAASFSGYGVVDGETTTPPGWTGVALARAEKVCAHIVAVDPAPDSAVEWPSEVSSTWIADEFGMAVFGALTALVAPPARLFPRGDGLGVGGGRRFPPPRSQQRSGRRFGFY